VSQQTGAKKRKTKNRRRKITKTAERRLRSDIKPPITKTPRPPLNLTGARQVAEIVDRCVHQQGI
jgi:hypothetical protein